MSTVVTAEPPPTEAAARGGKEGAGGRAEPLAVTAWALMANTVVTSGLGVAFWGIASRIYSPHELGEDAALISAMMLLSAVSQMNLSMGIPRLLPQVRDRLWRPVVGAYGATAAAAAALTVCFAYVAPRVSAGFEFLADEPWLIATLVAAVVLWNVFALQDAVLTSARWAPVIPVENALFGLLKIGLMVVLSRGVTDHGVFLAWVVGMAVLLLPMNGLLFTKVLRPGRGSREAPATTSLPLQQRDRVARYLVTDYVAALLSQGSTALLPILVIGALGRAQSAYFYIAFLITTAVGALSHSLSVSLLAEGAHDESDVVSLTRRSLARYVKFVVPTIAAVAVAAPLVLAPFGAAYVTNGTAVLRLLLAGTVVQAVVTIYLGMERVRARAGRILAVEGVSVTLVVLGAIVGMRMWGLAGLGVAWLGAHTIVAAAVAPSLWRVLTGAGPKAREPLRRGGQGVGAARFDAGGLADVVAASVAVALLVLTGLGVTGTATLVLGLVFLTFVPGWALLDHVNLARSTSKVALAVALSLAVTTLATVASLWLDLWQPHAVLEILGAASIVALAWRLRHPSGPAEAHCAGAR